MNDTLRQQLKHPEARIRQQAVVKLARMKDDEVLPLLNDIAKNDPEPSLRKIAERAITHILNEYSSTMSRVKPQEPILSDIPPFSNPKAEQHIQTAYKLYENGSNANALQYLIRAIDLAPLLCSDPDVQRLAGNLTGTDGSIAIHMLADREQRKKFFDGDSPSPPSKPNFPTSPSMWIIFCLFMVVASKFFWADGVEIINQALDELEIQQLKQSVQQINGINYYRVIPDQQSIEADYPVLIAIPDGQENATAMLQHFSDTANLYNTILLIPDFPDYRFSQIPLQTETVDAMITDVEQDYSLDESGVLFFGFGDGAMIATQYANQHPDQTAGVITSGGTFLYPPPEDMNYTVIYGADDTLLRDVTDTDVPFANIEDWSSSLNYLTIENIGHEVNSQQIDITAQMIVNLYQ